MNTGETKNMLIKYSLNNSFQDFQNVYFKHFCKC